MPPGRSRALRPDPPTAPFACPNLVTIGAVEKLRQVGMHEKIALVGSGDFPLADVVAPAGR
jgi:DNA-binding LacI/PurR family transcriptional regulator